LAIYEDKVRGTLYVDLRYRNSTGKIRLIKRRGFKTEQAAIRAENRILREQKVDDLPKSSIPFNQIALEFIQNKRHDVKETTYESLIQKVNSFMPTTPIGSLTARKALAWRNALGDKTVSGRPYSTKYKNEIVSMFRSICDYAIKLDYIARDPSILVERFPKKYGDDFNYTIVAPEQFYDSYHALPEKTMINIWFKHMVLLAYNTGARRAELKGLLFRDYDGRGIDINKTVTGKNKQDRDRFESTKTKYGIRYIPLDKYSIQETNRFIELYKKYKVYGVDKFIFGADHSLPINTIQSNFIRMNLGCRFHDLRHSHATLLIQNGVPINLVSKRLGHSNVAITLKVYTHAFKEDTDQVTSTLNEIYGQI
jgi:integrase